ncbi:hypothetical protein SPHV1_560033 [Novosphingobium sp. KN65.2]|nr:hypothetical protein SPHV1_560033 [Novosphingobium sp. KN65.2]
MAPALMLVACGQTQTVPDSNEATGSPVSEAGMKPDQATEIEATVSSDKATDTAKSQLTPDAERGETGARDVLLDFARAIELGQYAKAWAMLSPADREKWSQSRFAALFADLDKPTVAVPSGVMEGAAGSSYYTAPLTVTGTDKDGRPVRLEGEAVLRRVNDIGGASPAQLRWHLESVKLDWTH